MSEVKTTQTEWPRVGRYIGSCPSETPGIILCPPDLIETVGLVLQPNYQRRRVYGDEIELAEDRINDCRKGLVANSPQELAVEKYINQQCIKAFESGMWKPQF